MNVDDTLATICRMATQLNDALFLQRLQSTILSNYEGNLKPTHQRQISEQISLP